ncbi:MAG: hypothetical protein IPH51_17960 [Rubrivivax sp.]|nr:hypothetical protein [Rubrivivax sp.]
MPPSRPTLPRSAVARAIFGDGVGDHLGQGIPLRRRPAELLGVVERQALEALLLAGGAVEVEQHQPGLGVRMALA